MRGLECNVSTLVEVKEFYGDVVDAEKFAGLCMELEKTDARNLSKIVDIARSMCTTGMKVAKEDHEVYSVRSVKVRKKQATH